MRAGGDHSNFGLREGRSLERDVHWRGAFINENTVLTKAQSWFLLLVITRSYLRICVRFGKSSSVGHC